MKPAHRLILAVTFCGLALATAGCGSNNTGKIVGKWKFVSGKGMEAQKATMDTMKAYLFIDFKPDSTVTIGTESSDPAMQKLMGAALEKGSTSAKYSLKAGDKVELYDMPKQSGGGGGFFGGKDRAQTNIKIDGSKMTMTDPDGSTFQLEKI